MAARVATQGALTAGLVIRSCVYEREPPTGYPRFPAFIFPDNPFTRVYASGVYLGQSRLLAGT